MLFLCLLVVPHVTKFETLPSLAECGDFASVENFTVSLRGVGSIQFLGLTDIRNLDIDELVQINHREVF